MEQKFFKDRKDAGEKLGLYLNHRYKAANPVVLGIPRGGFEVAYYVARQMNVALSMVISKKLPSPLHREFGFGAIAEDHSIYIPARHASSYDPDIMHGIIEEQKKEVDRRVNRYRGGKPLPDIAGRTVILVDDGIATGVTLVPVLKLCRSRKADKVIIAVPVSGNNFDPKLNEADAIEVLVRPELFYAVGQVYQRFGDMSDEEVMMLWDQSTDLNST